jgi:inorganic pyrophosphatase
MFHHIPIGDKFPEVVNAIIEVPQGGHNKYEYDEKLGVIKLDRVLHSPLHYPFDYGFIPETRSDDGDHLDVMVYTNAPMFPGCLIEVRPVAIMYMSDEHGVDEKILAVPLNNPNFSHITRMRDVPPHSLKEIEHFFREYKRLENKEVQVDGWDLRKQAYRVIKSANKKYLAEL